ncbi:hypothetical protein EXIGLDRAFT_766312 [Exidia glandulosa HHB12029]|uniref:Uncharacterized protein n=1 Tax=Exidia glandulosa HHB12029 TaxID=1314781 RepID=A0A166AUF9_EXIGL|nr:hypothetical protein EXIGLDRAFT_766312 [Exidia glandulosa HHB12029]
MPALPNDPPLDEVNIISSWIESWLLGMHCVLYGFCMYILWPRRKATTPRVLMCITTLMVTLAVAHASLSLRGLLEGFIWQFGGPDASAYYANFAAMPYKLKNVIYVLNSFMADGLLLWRVWVVWSRSWKVTAAPALMFVGSMIAEVFTTISLWQLQPNESLFSPTVSKWFTSLWALSLATNVTCTALIVAKIARSSHSTRTYTSIIAIIVESGALYTISVALLMTFFLLNANAGQIANDVTTQLSVIGPTLIIVVVGRRMAVQRTVPAPISTSGTSSVPMSPISPRMRPISRLPGSRGVVVAVTQSVEISGDEKDDEKHSDFSVV